MSETDRQLINIVVLDGYALNPGDLSWAGFEALGRCTIFDRTAPDQVMARTNAADALLTNKTELTGADLKALSRLKYIGVLATGTNVVDLAAAREQGVTVTNIPSYGTRSVAQTTVALLLELTQHVGAHSETVRKGKWTRHVDWSYWDYPLIELDGLTMGIIGFGRIGQAVAHLAAAFGMRVIANTRTMPHATAKTTELAPSQAVEFVELEQIFRRSDVLSLHCPLTPLTDKLVNAERLAWMKPSAFLLNTSRGGLIDETALALALNSGRLAGAGLDVLSKEPPPADHPLLSAKNCLVTPHFAWATYAARARLMKIAAENLRAFLAGAPQNVVTNH